MSPSVVLDQKYEMLHVPVKEIVQDASIAKERIVEGRNVCGIHFTNGDAFAVASVMNCEGKELAVRYFKGGKEYTHRCSKVLEKILLCKEYDCYERRKCRIVKYLENG